MNSISGHVGGSAFQAQTMHLHGAWPSGGYRIAVQRFVAKDFADRDTELAEIAAFVRGTEPYSWWVGEPWAGKTALAAAVVTQPPADVTVVSFFVSRADGVHRLADYRRAVTEQLAALTGQVFSSDIDELWEQAASRVAADGRSLLLVVDGLDENEDGDEPSIASQLPMSCPHGSHVLVTSRLHPDVPDDVRSSHPLRSCPKRLLLSNSHATASEHRAHQDLKLHLRDPKARQVLGLLAVARGPLSAEDLATVVGDFYETRVLLEESMARLLKPGYSLAHETLLATTVERLGPAYLAERVEELHQWASRQHDLGWPADTPDYLVDSYPLLLKETSDAKRLNALCCLERFRLLRGRTGTNHLALRELEMARDLQHELPDLVRLTLWINQLRNQVRQVPEDLPVLLAKVGRVREAENLARSLSQPSRQASALARIAAVTGTDRLAVDAANLVHADELAGIAVHLGRPELFDQAIQEAGQDSGLAKIAWHLAPLGDVGRIEQILDRIESADHHANATAALAVAQCEIGRLDQATATARSIRAEFARVTAITSVARAHARRGDLVAAQRFASRLPGAANRVRALAEVAVGLAEFGDLARCGELLASTMVKARALSGSMDRERAEVVVAVCAAKSGLLADALRYFGAFNLAHRTELLDDFAVAVGAHDPERALDAAMNMVDVRARVRVLVRIALATDDPDWQRKLLHLAESSVAGFDADFWETIAEVATVVLDAGRAVPLVERLTRITGMIVNPEKRAQALACGAVLARRTGQDDGGALEESIRLLEGLGDHSEPDFMEAVDEVVRASGQCGRPEYVDRLLDLLPEEIGSMAWGELAEAVAQAGLLDLAEIIFDRLVGKPAGLPYALARVAVVAVDADRPDLAEPWTERAESLVRDLSTSSGDRMEALIYTARALLRLGHRERADVLLDKAEQATTDDLERRLITSVCEDRQRCERVIGAIESPHYVRTAQVHLAEALFETGQLDRAKELVVRLLPFVSKISLLRLASRLDPAVVAVLADTVESIADYLYGPTRKR